MSLARYLRSSELRSAGCVLNSFTVCEGNHGGRSRSVMWVPSVMVMCNSSSSSPNLTQNILSRSAQAIDQLHNCPHTSSMGPESDKTATNAKHTIIKQIRSPDFYPGPQHRKKAINLVVTLLPSLYCWAWKEAVLHLPQWIYKVKTAFRPLSMKTYRLIICLWHSQETTVVPSDTWSSFSMARGRKEGLVYK